MRIREIVYERKTQPVQYESEMVGVRAALDGEDVKECFRKIKTLVQEELGVVEGKISVEGPDLPGKKEEKAEEPKTKEPKKSKKQSKKAAKEEAMEIKVYDRGSSKDKELFFNLISARMEEQKGPMWMKEAENKKVVGFVSKEME
jgi:hypothetical protein